MRHINWQSIGTVICLWIFLAALTACSSKAPEKSETQEKKLPIAWLEVEVTYADGSFLPKASVMTLTLEDVSKMDAPSELIGETALELEGPPPFPASIGYDPGLIREGKSYVVRAVIRHYDRLLYTTTTATDPFAKETPGPVTVRVDRVPRPKASQD